MIVRATTYESIRERSKPEPRTQQSHNLNSSRLTLPNALTTIRAAHTEVLNLLQRRRSSLHLQQIHQRSQTFPPSDRATGAHSLSSSSSDVRLRDHEGLSQVIDDGGEDVDKFGRVVEVVLLGRGESSCEVLEERREVGCGERRFFVGCRLRRDEER